MTRYAVHVDDDVIHAETEDEARAIFLATLVDDTGLIEVSEAPEEDE